MADRASTDDATVSLDDPGAPPAPPSPPLDFGLEFQEDDSTSPSTDPSFRRNLVIDPTFDPLPYTQPDLLFDQSTSTTVRSTGVLHPTRDECALPPPPLNTTVRHNPNDEQVRQNYLPLINPPLYLPPIVFNRFWIPALPPPITHGSNDVLCGRGGKINMHQGNIQFRKIVADNKERYLRTPKNEKMNVAREVVKLVKDRRGRFLEKTPKGGWKDVGDKKAEIKASQALREGKEKGVEKGEVSADTGKRKAEYKAEDIQELKNGFLTLTFQEGFFDEYNKKKAAENKIKRQVEEDNGDGDENKDGNNDEDDEDGGEDENNDEKNGEPQDKDGKIGGGDADGSCVVQRTASV